MTTYRQIWTTTGTRKNSANSTSLNTDLQTDNRLRPGSVMPSGELVHEEEQGKLHYLEYRLPDCSVTRSGEHQHTEFNFWLAWWID